MRNIIYASFTDTETATKAFGALLDHGVRAEDVSVLAKSLPSTENHEPLSSEQMHSQAEIGITTTTSADATAGAIKGAGVGLGVGVLAAIASLVIPGVGVVMGAGALALAFAGVASTTAAGAVAGATVGILKDQGIDPETAHAYASVVESGGSILSVSVPSGSVDETMVDEILVKYGAARDFIKTVPYTMSDTAVVSVTTTTTDGVMGRETVVTTVR